MPFSNYTVTDDKVIKNSRNLINHSFSEEENRCIIKFCDKLPDMVKDREGFTIKILKGLIKKTGVWSIWKIIFNSY